jgi:hypothetical protein
MENGIMDNGISRQKLLILLIFYFVLLGFGVNQGDCSTLSLTEQIHVFGGDKDLGDSTWSGYRKVPVAWSGSVVALIN